MSILVCSNAPPGKRCKRYIAYSEILARALKVPARVVYDARESAVKPPALIIAGRVLTPADGLVLTAEDVVAALREQGVLAEAGLLSALRAAEES